MFIIQRLSLLTIILLSLSGYACALEPVSFTRDIRPILSDNCFACHGPDQDKREAGLRLDVADSALQSGAVAPGELNHSELWTRINSVEESEVMPPPESHQKLDAEERELIRRWIESGAEYQQHWSFVTPTKPPVPVLGSASGIDVAIVANPIDAFLQQRLVDAGLTPSPLADRHTLIRRVTLDLTGLPPTPDEVDAFIGDSSVNAYEKLIDELMSRTTYAEHMARYWLDLARYADTHGLHLDNERSMWPYRDWVVQAFQQNLPFDDFTRWQLAGDLLEEPTREQLVASGFNRCNVSTSEGGSINEEWIFRYAVDRTTTAAEVWLGLTAGCAVCHDHKFDPISAKEFYSMYAFFHSAADPAMDGNKIDTPPTLKLYSPEQQAAVDDLNQQLAVVQTEIRAKLDTIQYVDPALIDPPPTLLEQESVWMEDAFPDGAKVEFAGLPTMFVRCEDGDVFSGQTALRRCASGVEQDFYSSGAAEFVVPAGGIIFVQCLLDIENPPEAIMLQFHTTAWNHRAVWGDEAKIPFGKLGTAEKVHMGGLPDAGQWMLLEVDAKKIGLKTGDKVKGFAFTQFSGMVTWDRLGVRSTVDTTKDEAWSWAVWKEKKVGKRNNELPDGLRELVRGKKAEQWNDEETKSVYEHWLEHFYAGASELLADLNSDKMRLETQKTAIEVDVPLTLVMADLPQPRESFVMLRGAYDKPGDPVTRQVPAFLPPLGERPTDRDANRLDFANWLVSGQHPLTSRVTVNRMWQQFFGVGIVRTSADFGSQGEPPSHPELLDWLAVEFVDQGWDMRQLIRLMLTSHAYRQSSRVTTEASRLDPENRLFSHAPRLRLDAEVLRDQALFVSGLLVNKAGGAPVKPYQPPNIWEPVAFGGSNTKTYVQDHGDALYRRSLYTFLKRTAPPPFMSTFDAPSRELSCSYRQRSNTPMQALQLLNDIQHVEAARCFAARIVSEGGTQTQDRIYWAWQVVTGRQPTDVETRIAADVLEKHLQRYKRDTDAAKQLVVYGESPMQEQLDASELAAYTLLANLILNLDETVTKN